MIFRGAGIPPAIFLVSTVRKKRRRDAGATTTRSPCTSHGVTPLCFGEKTELAENLD
ncbi:MAG TPA: hypothetical protein VK770_08495 [Candidatus Acidoferrum sp.]|nr:hypothetical protein [Candidatus Acidoferrum sp.]